MFVHTNLFLLDEHDSPQLYDIVHFEHKLSWFCFGHPEKELSLPLEQSMSSLNQGSLESSNKVHPLFDTLATFLLCLRGSQYFTRHLRICQSIDMTKFRT